ncbi:MAG TPA: CRISPR-associated protein Cas5 [Blastocatellia bacterium]|nr:CRISPR-associated protein Cas5 [Blastocatellia bacterium]
MKLLYVRLEGWTATFRLPLIYSGTGLTSPVPPYSTLLGLIGALAGREIAPDETRIGYVFRSHGTGFDLETTRRLELGSNGKLKPQKVPGIARRQFHTRPSLDLYLDNPDLRQYFEFPANPPCLGRSQDLAWITCISEVEAEATPAGTIRGTLIPFPQPGATGVILPLPDYLLNDQKGFTRQVGRVTKFQAVRYEAPAQIRRDDLYRLEGAQKDEVIYLRSLSR